MWGNCTGSGEKVTVLQLENLETVQLNLRVSTPQSHLSSRDEPIINDTEDGFTIYQEGNSISFDFGTIDMKIFARVKGSIVKCISSYNRSICPVSRIYIGRVACWISCR